VVGVAAALGEVQSAAAACVGGQADGDGPVPGTAKHGKRAILSL